jgi:FAD/FMN-containing dehydrogenase
MGLTGIVLSLTIQLKKIETAFIQTENIKARNLTHVLELLDEFENATYTVAWTDCLSKGSQQGRSILMKGEHAALSEIQGTKFATAPLGGASSFKAMVPFYFPSFALNSLTVKAFNFLYYHKQTSPIVRKLTHYDSFFYPLDAIYYWNRIYGKRGFTQYQFVIPKEKGQVGLKKIMDKISDKGMGSFLVVLKSFGAQESPFLSFPQAGYTLAMDFPIEPKLFPFLAELDEIVLEYGGRVYLTKDTRLPADTFRKMYPNLPMFQSVLAEINATRKWQSLQSMRLEI